MSGANKTVLLLPEKKQRGVANQSGGKNAQAQEPAVIPAGKRDNNVMPENESKLKIAAVNGYGAESSFLTRRLKKRGYVIF